MAFPCAVVVEEAAELVLIVVSWNRAGDEFVAGNIVEIEVHNFMTYTHLKSRPGTRLNLVIGPNGTGKSSLVCAIGIGLAGEPAVSNFSTTSSVYCDILLLMT